MSKTIPKCACGKPGYINHFCDFDQKSHSMCDADYEAHIEAHKSIHGF